jgi:hypothetical protein
VTSRITKFRMMEAGSVPESLHMQPKNTFHPIPEKCCDLSEHLLFAALKVYAVT